MCGVCACTVCLSLIWIKAFMHVRMCVSECSGLKHACVCVCVCVSQCGLCWLFVAAGLFSGLKHVCQSAGFIGYF